MFPTKISNWNMNYIELELDGTLAYSALLLCSKNFILFDGISDKIHVEQYIYAHNVYKLHAYHVDISFSIPASILTVKYSQ